MNYFYFHKVNCPFCNNRTYPLTGQKVKYITCTLCGNDLKVATKKDLGYILQGKIYKTEK